MPSNHNIYEFGEFRLDADEGELYKHNNPVPLNPKAIQVLLLLVSNNGQVLTKDQIMDEVWKDTFVEPNGVETRISKLRKVLGITKPRKSKKEPTNQNRSPKVPQLKKSFDIITLTKAYKFIGEVKIIAKDKTPNLIDDTPPLDETTAPSSVNSGRQMFVKDELNALNAENESISNISIFMFAAFGLAVAVICLERGWYYGNQTLEKPEQIIFIFIACFCYGLLNAIGMVLEVAYQFDKFGWKIINMIPTVFFLNLFAMFWALTHALFILPNGLSIGIGRGFLILLTCALINCALGYFVLPNIPVAVATFETQPALTAYRKNVLLYFLPIYSAFGLAVFCFMNANFSTSGNIVISATLLSLLLIITFISYFSTNYLSDRLLTKKRGIVYSRKFLYSSLLFWRAVFCFMPAFIFVLWYLLRSLERYLYI